MEDQARSPEPQLDDRISYEVVLAAIRVITRHSDCADEEAVMARILDVRGPAYHTYLTTLAQAQHSIFSYQMQDLYGFGKELVSAEVRDDFCFLVGSEFAATLLAENFHPLQQVALASDVDFQKVIVEIIRLYTGRHTGDKYDLSAEFGRDAILLKTVYRSPERIMEYMQEYGLEPESSFRNSVGVIAGAIEHFASRLTAGYDASMFRVEFDGLAASIELPVRATDRFNYEALIQTFATHVRALEERQSASDENTTLRDDLIVGSSLMRERWGKIRRASRTDELILLRGESGTGKSLMASKIHELSARHDKPFIEVGLTSDVGSDNMIQSDLFGHERGAFTGADRQKKGLFALADGGTIFLDEIGDASPDVQAKLLRVLENSRFRRLGGTEDISVDVRVIAATNCDLEQMVEEKAFRQDLYFRLNVISLDLPSLRDRPEDIPALAQFLLARAQADGKRPAIRLSEELANQLEHHPWPGNIRELDHALRQAIALTEATVIGLDDLPANVAAGIRGRIAAEESADPVPVPLPPEMDGGDEDVIDEDRLRRLIRSANPIAVGTSERHTLIPAHIEFAKRKYLGVLIDELGGDFSLIAQFWDRGSEKTLRNMIRSYALTDRLEAARQRRRTRT